MLPACRCVRLETTAGDHRDDRRLTSSATYVHSVNDSVHGRAGHNTTSLAFNPADPLPVVTPMIPTTTVDVVTSRTTSNCLPLCCLANNWRYHTSCSVSLDRELNQRSNHRPSTFNLWQSVSLLPRAPISLVSTISTPAVQRR